MTAAAAATGAERVSARIDLDAVRHNAAVLRAAAGGAALMAVVKAEGYGHGAVPVARSALEAGASWLGVATAGEAEELRAAGLTAPMLVMGPLGDADLERVMGANTEIELWSPVALPALAALAARHGRPVPVHLKLDTGMGRLGARPEQVEALADAAADALAENVIAVTGLMTHFATADEEEGENAGFLAEQLVRFRAAVSRLRPRFPDAVVHAANSAATLREPGAAFDLVRCGIGLYGCSPFGRDPADHDLRPAMTLASRLGAIKTIRSRESVGYGRTFKAQRGTRIGVVPVGYGDGYARRLANRAQALVGGRRVPVVGSISMDQLTIDLGPEGGERVGDEVVLLGAQGDARVSAEELAAWWETISYEVTCSVSARVPRVHTG